MGLFDNLKTLFASPQEVTISSPDDVPLGDEAVGDLEVAPEDDPGTEGDNSELASKFPDLKPAEDDPSRSV